MKLIEIGETGSLADEVVVDDFLREVIDATVSHYQRTCFLPPWIGYVGSIWDCQIPRCRAVTALSEVVCYREDAADNPNLHPLFARVFDALEPGGLFILDVAEIGLDRERDRTFAEGDDWACFVGYKYEEATDRLHRHITSFRRVDSLFRRSREHHIVQLYDGNFVAESLNRVGFQTQRVRNFGLAALLPLRLGFIARRPS